jgi:hypothetical protein
MDRQGDPDIKHAGMFRSYILSAFRAIRQSSSYGLLNITGLALGIACTTLIFLWIEDELSFDHQYTKRDQLYSILMNLDYSNKIETNWGVPWQLADAIRAAIPEVVNITRMGGHRELFAPGGDSTGKSIYENGLSVDTGFFSMLQPVFIKGSTAGFTNPHTLILTATMAAKFFGPADPIGKTLRVGNQQDYTVIGIVKDVPGNVSIRYDWLERVQNFQDKYHWLRHWAGYGISTLVELRPGANLNKIDSQMTAILRPKDPLYAKANCLLWSMNNWHLRSHFTNGQPDGGLITVVHIVSVIGWIILLIACINFMNLSTARAGHRAREVGVRKTLGAMRKALIGQFLLESLFMSFAAVVLAIFLVYPALPGFNMLVGKELTFSPFTPVHLAALIFISFFCGVIAGSYPAFYLSSFNVVAVLKGQLIGSRAGAGAGVIRRGLVVTQFTFSVGLIVCTVITNQQLQYLRSRDLGYNKEHLLYAPLEGDLANHFDAFKAGLLQTGLVANVAISHSPPLAVWSSNTSEQMTWPGASPDKKVQINWEWGSPEYLSTMGLQVKEGRNFYGDVKADSGDAIINETLAAIMGKDGHIGGYLTYIHRDRYRIIGIVKDYLFNDMRGNVAPLLLTCEPEVRRIYDFLEIRLRSGNDLPASMAKVEAIEKTINPGYPFDYHFVDEEFDHIFTIESRVGEFAGIFSLLAILISCLGLFGLAAYTTECRTKEVGIRKVLGASVASLARLLSKEFLQLVALSCLIAFPLAWGFMNYWLKDFAYHTAVHWWIFALAGAAAFLIALLTVSSLAIKAALMNPVETLRAE